VIGCYDSSFLISQMTLTPVFGTGQSREENRGLLRSPVGGKGRRSGRDPRPASSV